MPDQVSLQEQIQCVAREIGYRERVYPRWVNLKPKAKMSAETADYQLRAMRAVLVTLQALASNGGNQ